MNQHQQDLIRLTRDKAETGRRIGRANILLNEAKDISDSEGVRAKIQKAQDILIGPE